MYKNEWIEFCSYYFDFQHNSFDVIREVADTHITLFPFHSRWLQVMALCAADVFKMISNNHHDYLK